MLENNVFYWIEVALEGIFYILEQKWSYSLILLYDLGWRMNDAFRNIGEQGQRRVCLKFSYEYSNNQKGKKLAWYYDTADRDSWKKR